MIKCLSGRGYTLAGAFNTPYVLPLAALDVHVSRESPGTPITVFYPRPQAASFCVL